MAPIQRLRILRDEDEAMGADGAMVDENAMVEEIAPYEDLDVDQVIERLSDEVYRFDYKYQDYVLDRGFLKPILEDLEAVYGDEALSLERLVEQVGGYLDAQVPAALDRNFRNPSGNSARLSIALPDLQPNFSSLDPRELERQLAGQLDAINEMSVADWLHNVLLNRLKSVDTITSESHGTRGGLALAQWLNRQLLSNDALARFAMQAVIRNIDSLSTRSSDYRDSRMMANLLDTALISHAMDDEVFATFEALGGIEILEELNRAGLQGGLGRQHGEGDERWFREQFLSGVELLKQEDAAIFESNAVLHNPDQCAGGDMAICSGGELAELTEARDRFLATRSELARLQGLIAEGTARLERLRGDLANYDERLPGWQQFSATFNSAPPPTRQQLTAQIAVLEADLGGLETAYAEVEQASDTTAKQYRDVLRPHLGNRAVNSFLGRQWMEPQGDLEGQGRTERLIRQAVALLEATDVETLEGTQMDVGLEVDPEARVGAFFDEAMEFSSDDEAGLEEGDLGAHQAPVKRARVGARRSRGRLGTGGLSKGKKAVLGKGSVDRFGKQQTLDSLRIRRRTTSGLRETLAALRGVCRIGHASGVGMNCLIRAVLRAGGREDNAATVRDIRRNAWALGLVGDEEMFDLDTGGGAAVLQQIQGVLGGGFTLHVLQVDPQTGRPATYDRITVGGGGQDLYILHLGAHFSPLFPVAGWAAWIDTQVDQDHQIDRTL